MPYRFLENIAMADIAFEASGETLKEVFESAAAAMTNIMVRDLKAVEHKSEKDISVVSDSAEMLLFNFLQEIIFYKDAEQLLFSRFEVDVITKDGRWIAEAKAYGEKLDMVKHELTVDAKAVTMHHFRLVEERGGWIATVIVDT